MGKCILFKRFIHLPVKKSIVFFVKSNTNIIVIFFQIFFNILTCYQGRSTKFRGEKKRPQQTRQSQGREKEEKTQRKGEKRKEAETAF